MAEPMVVVDDLNIVYKVYGAGGDRGSAATGLLRVAEGQRRTARHVDLLELPFREKTHPATIRRPERVACTGSAGKHPRVQRIKVAEPQIDLSIENRGDRIRRTLRE